MRAIPRKTAIASLATIALLTAPALTGSASAATLNGDWAPFTRCPVDNSAMLAADGVNTVALCVAADSPSGTITAGNLTVATGDSNLQFGIVDNNVTGTSTIVSPAGGAISAAPVNVPGGLLGLMCPSSIPLITAICDQITNSTLNRVTATIQDAGNPSNFDLTAGLSSGVPIVTLPVKIQLSNPFLSSTCAIGTNSNPIVLQVQNLSVPNIAVDQFDPNGTSDPNGTMQQIGLSGASQNDSTFAVPGASGCGLFGLIDTVINQRLGLPSASGHNSATLNNTATFLAGFADPTTVAPNEGNALSAAWHSAAH